MGPIGISLLVSNTQVNGGGWKELAENKGETFEDLFMKKCNNFNFSRVLECFDIQSFSTDEIYKQVSVNKTKLRNVLSLKLFLSPALLSTPPSGPTTPKNAKNITAFIQLLNSFGFIINIII